MPSDAVERREPARRIATELAVQHRVKECDVLRTHSSPPAREPSPRSPARSCGRPRAVGRASRRSRRARPSRPGRRAVGRCRRSCARGAPRRRSRADSRAPGSASAPSRTDALLLATIASTESTAPCRPIIVYSDARLVRSVALFGSLEIASRYICSAPAKSRVSLSAVASVLAASMFVESSSTARRRAGMAFFRSAVAA